MDPLFEFWIDSLPISRISHAAPDHNLPPSQDAQSTICYIIVYQPRGGADRHSHLYLFHCPRHLTLSLSLVLQYPQSKLGEVSQSANSVNHSSARMCTGWSPTLCSRWFGMSDENRLVLDFVAQIQRNQASNAIPPATATHSHTQNQHDRNLAVQQVPASACSTLCMMRTLDTDWIQHVDEYDVSAREAVPLQGSRR